MPEHAIHRRTDLVTHRREEGRLRPVGRLGLGARRLSHVTLTLGGFARGLQLLEQPDVLDGDHGLVGEGRDKVDLPFGVRLHTGTTQADDTDRHAFAQQRHAKHAADPANPCIVLLGVVRVVPGIDDLHGPPFQRRASDQRVSARPYRLLPPIPLV